MEDNYKEVKKEEPCLKLIHMDQVEVEEIEWLFYPFIPYGKVTIIQGDPGEGKTTVVLQIIAKLTKGELLWIDVHADFLRLGIEQQGQCKAFYKEICPYVIESVLTRDKDNKVEFIAERSQVSRGIIEVLYLLRCSLMHGEVFPDNNAMEVYKYAYSILAAILKKMF